jgi:small-conductance mechanosensitive channel
VVESFFVSQHPICAIGIHHKTTLEQIMKKNLGSVERILRVFVALVIAILYFTNQISGVAAAVLGVIAVAFVLTSSAGFCPIYASLRFFAKKSEIK